MIALAIACVAASLSVAFLMLIDTATWATGMRATLWNATIYLSLTIPLLSVALRKLGQSPTEFAEVETDCDRNPLTNDRPDTGALALP